MRRVTRQPHPDLRIRAVRSWPREHGREAPDLTLSAADRVELGRLAQVIEYKTIGSQIFAQGQEAEFLYLLAEGVVRTCHTLHNGDRQVLAFLWPGDIFGLAENGRYVNAAETVAAARVRRFPVRKLEEFLLRHPGVQDGFLVKAVHDLRIMQRQIIVMGRFDTLRRLAAFLVDCSAHDAYFDRDGKVLTLPMSRDDIADYLGTSAETVTRGFGRLETDGLIRRHAAREVTLNMPGLRAFIDPDD